MSWLGRNTASHYLLFIVSVIVCLMAVFIISFIVLIMSVIIFFMAVFTVTFIFMVLINLNRPQTRNFNFLVLLAALVAELRLQGMAVLVICLVVISWRMCRSWG